MKKISSNTIDFQLIAEGLGLTVEETIKFFNDGRIMGRLGEFKYQHDFSGERQKENAHFDVQDVGGDRVEVRSITKGISFASSKEVGYGRKVTQEGFSEKLNSLDKYLLLDLRELKNGSYDFIEIEKEELKNLPLRKNKSMSSEKFFEIYDRTEQNL